MPGSSFEAVVELATEQHGYVTTSQARAVGVSKDALHMMAKRGTVERVSWGLYRVPSIPPSPYSEYMEAALWPGGRTATISHESALSVYGLSDVSPDRTHVTVPPNYRTHREVPDRLRLHHADLAQDEIRRVEGVPVTAPERTIRDCHAGHVSARLLRQAIEEGRREGYLTPERARELAAELLPTSGAGSHD